MHKVKLKYPMYQLVVENIQGTKSAGEKFIYKAQAEKRAKKLRMHSVIRKVYVRYIGGKVKQL